LKEEHQRLREDEEAERERLETLIAAFKEVRHSFSSFHRPDPAAAENC
jgi:hypothetical protein